MPILLIFLAVMGTALAGYWGEALTEVSLPLQMGCASLISENSPHSALYRALLCGQRLPPQNQLRQVMSQLGLIHLLVVSGAHLLWLEQLAQALGRRLFPRRQDLFSLCFIFFFALSCGLQAPVLRSAIALSLRKLQRHFCLFWSPGQVVALSALLSLPLLSQGLNSFSLQLSWAASLGFCLPIKQKGLSRSLIRAALIYLFLSPLLSPSLPLPHPSSVIVNALFAGGLLSTWLSLSLLHLLHFLPFVGSLTDSLMDFSFYLLDFVREAFPAPWNLCILSSSNQTRKFTDFFCSGRGRWLYLISLQSMVLTYEAYQRRSSLWPFRERQGGAEL